GELEAVAAEVAAARDEPADRMLGIELGAQLMIASGEQLFTALDLDGARVAYDRAETILREVPPAALVDARFQALQGTALVAQVTRAFGRAAERLQSIVRLIHAHASPRDELEARISLGHMLTQLGKHEEAARHMELARMLARHAAGVDDQLLATQSAALAALHGKSYGRALDRAYEALELAGRDKRDLASYVAVVSLISLIHQARDSPSDAYLTLVYAAASVRQRLGAHAAIAFEAQIAELKTAMGAERFEAMCEAIVRAREARERADAE
ncbi:MAG TPA: hypothetical protein VK601_20895, partial [Kofleriaceae bacterium]|nr:hypothetical protein [Kofleriaceae bacterium]